MRKQSVTLPGIRWWQVAARLQRKSAALGVGSPALERGCAIGCTVAESWLAAVPGAGQPVRVSCDDLQKQWLKRCQADPRSDAELLTMVRACRGDADDPRFWDAVAVLHGRFTRQLFDEVLPWTADADPALRSSAVTLLAQVHKSCPELKPHVGELFLRLCQTETDAAVKQSLAFALGHVRPPGGLAPLLAFAQSEDADFRYAATHSLLGEDDPAAIRALIRLSADTDSDVRDWATFGLGSHTELDTPELREALWARTDDPDSDTRGEAIVGLALRRDERVVPVMERELAMLTGGSLVLEAIAAFPHRRFVAALEALSPDDFSSSDLADAIAACRQATAE